MKKKILAMALAMVAIIVGVASGTVAWLSATTESVKNTFTTSNIDITLTETTGKEYKMVPGYTITKDPTVTVKGGSEACWLFVKVETANDFGNYMTYAMAEGWTALSGVDNVYYREVAASDKDVSYGVIEDNEITVLDTVTQSQMDSAEKVNPTLTVTAYASQLYKDGTEKFSAAEAWANIK